MVFINILSVDSHLSSVQILFSVQTHYIKVKKYSIKMLIYSLFVIHSLM